jgi:hypothetical protein
MLRLLVVFKFFYRVFSFCPSSTLHSVIVSRAISIVTIARIIAWVISRGTSVVDIGSIGKWSGGYG